MKGKVNSYFTEPDHIQFNDQHLSDIDIPSNTKVRPSFRKNSIKYVIMGIMRIFAFAK